VRICPADCRQALQHACPSWRQEEDAAPLAGRPINDAGSLGRRQAGTPEMPHLLRRAGFAVRKATRLNRTPSAGTSLLISQVRNRSASLPMLDSRSFKAEIASKPATTSGPAEPRPKFPVYFGKRQRVINDKDTKPYQPANGCLRWAGSVSAPWADTMSWRGPCKIPPVSAIIARKPPRRVWLARSRPMLVVI